MKKLKGIVLVVILLLASIMMPFDVYAAVQSTIVPTFAGSTSSWSSHLRVTNFSDGTDNQASSILSFTFDDDYYGVVYFDGYGPNNQHIANYASVFIAGGYGEYRYSYYQNGVINITSVTIQIVNVVKPDSTVDLTQIIQLLTAIESDTNAIESYTSQTLTQIRSILSELIVSNGYLETLTELRQWNIPFESLSWVYFMFNNGFTYNTINPFDINYFQYPIFNVSNGDVLFQFYSSPTTLSEYQVVMLTNRNIYNLNTLNTYFSVDDGVFSDFVRINSFRNSGYTYNLIKFKISEFTVASSTIINFNFIGTNAVNIVIPILFVPKAYYPYISTDFALNFGLSNQLLDNLNIIANGTTQSNSAASDLESSNSQMADDMDDLATIENGYNQQFNNQLQSIDFTSPIQSNSGILPAANFVITIFNGLINNNPFSVLIIVVCILLIGKKVIGK